MTAEDWPGLLDAWESEHDAAIAEDAEPPLPPPIAYTVPRRPDSPAMTAALEVCAAAGRASRYAEAETGTWFADPSRYRLLQRWRLYCWATRNRQHDMRPFRAMLRAAVAYYRGVKGRKEMIASTKAIDREMAHLARRTCKPIKSIQRLMPQDDMLRVPAEWPREQGEREGKNNA